MGFGRDPLGFQVMKQGCRGLRVHLDTGGVPSQEAAAGVAAGSSTAPEENPLAFLSKSCFQSQLET